MAEETTLREILAPPPAVNLSTGGIVQTKKIRLPDLGPASALLGSLLEILAARLKRKPTEADLATHMPVLLAFLVVQQDPGAGEFLSYVSDAATFTPADEINGTPAAVEWNLPEEIDMGDVERLWQAVLQANRGPFELCFDSLTQEAVEMLMAISESASLPQASSPQELTPETQTSPPTTPSSSTTDTPPASAKRGTRKRS